MISRLQLNREELERISVGIPELLQPRLLEKVYRALSLLEGLSLSKLDVVFKGGTAVMLLLDQAQRFSIDIDIIHDTPLDFGVLEKISLESGFLGVEEQKRQSSFGIKKSHYKFLYKPILSTGSDQEAILLDILHDKNPYPSLRDTSITLSFFPIAGDPVSVKTPTIDGICGDKLTAFAPNTLGIPYMKAGSSSTLEIIKQLFDVGILFEKVSDIGAVGRSYVEIGQQEAAYRGRVFSLEESIRDTIQTALSISMAGALGEGNYSELRKGIKGLRQFVFSHRYGLSHAVTHAARAAYLAACILHNENIITRYDKSMDLNPLFTGKKPLDLLKKTNPEAFYYWYQIEKLIIRGLPL